MAVGEVCVGEYKKRIQTVQGDGAAGNVLSSVSATDARMRADARCVLN